jgi:hypothetical protein
MGWEQTIGLVWWRRIGPQYSEFSVVSVWSDGAGLVCGMKRGICRHPLGRNGHNSVHGFELLDQLVTDRRVE